MKFFVKSFYKISVLFLNIFQKTVQSKYKVEESYFEKAIKAQSLRAAVTDLGIGYIGSEKFETIRGKAVKGSAKDHHELLSVDQVKDVQSKF